MDLGIGSALIVLWIVLIATFLVVFLRPASTQAAADLDSRDPLDDRAAWRDARAERQRPPARAKTHAPRQPGPTRVKPGRSLFSPRNEAPGTR
jgi:hypothetical protein